jgi:hypothetical protein
MASYIQAKGRTKQAKGKTKNYLHLWAKENQVIS